MTELSATQPLVEEEASNKQLEALVKLHVPFELPLSKRAASQLLEEATRALDERRLEQIQADVDLRRTAFEKVKLDRDIAASGLEPDVELEIAHIRLNGREPIQRKAARSR